MKRERNIIWSIPKEEFESYIDSGLSRRQIGEKFGVSKSTVDIIFSRLKIHRELLFNINKFDIIDTEEKAYWLGFLYADGCVFERIRGKQHDYWVKLKLAIVDYDHLIKYKNFLEDIRGDECVKTFKSKSINGEIREYCSYTSYNKHFTNSLISLGCIQRKSLVLKFPDENIFSNKELVYDFIRGYIDGDGCLTTNGVFGRLQISIVGTFEFLKGIQKYFPQFKSIHLDKKGSKIYKINCAANKADEVAYKLYEHATIYLDRKHQKYTALCKLHNSETSDKIGESCDANAEVTSEIAKGSESTVENSE